MALQSANRIKISKVRETTFGVTTANPASSPSAKLSPAGGYEYFVGQALNVLAIDAKAGAIAPTAAARRCRSTSRRSS